MQTAASPSPNASSPPPASAECYGYRFSHDIFASFFVANAVLLLPLCGLVLALAARRRRRRRRAASHSDVIACHMAAMETLGVFGGAAYLGGAGLGAAWMSRAGLYLFSVTTYGQVLFHTLTCGERYLAVVHPVAYRGLRRAGGARARDACRGGVWLLLLASLGLPSLAGDFGAAAALCFLVLAAAAVSFCSVAVLRALTRPRPGGGGGGGGPRADPSKMRAFHTIAAILGALMIRVGGHLAVVALYASPAWSEPIRCAALVSGVWFCLPSSLVSPLLFLHRASVLRRGGKTGAGPPSRARS